MYDVPVGGPTGSPDCSVNKNKSLSTRKTTRPRASELQIALRFCNTAYPAAKHVYVSVHGEERSYDKNGVDKANANGARTFLTTSVPEMLHAMWEHEVAALKPRKRKAWKGHVSDVCGQNTVVVYCEEGIPIAGRAFVSHFKHRLSGQKKGQYRTEDDWQVVIPIGLPYSDCGPDGKLALHAQQENVTGAADLADMPLFDQLATMHAEREANMTGAHRPRNHHISVPTAPGQPTRG